MNFDAFLEFFTGDRAKAKDKIKKEILHNTPDRLNKLDEKMDRLSEKVEEILKSGGCKIGNV